MSNLIIIGAGGFAREVFAWIIQAQNHHRQRGCCPGPSDVIGFYAEEPGNQKSLLQLPVLSDLSHYQGCFFVCAIGDPATRERLSEQAKLAGLSPASPIVHPSAVAGNQVGIAPGSIICPGAILTTDILIEEGVIINIGATVGHDCRIGRYTTISPGANLSGRVDVGTRSYIGTNCAIREGLRIGSDSVCGMGSVVVKSVPDHGKVIGNPARQMSVRAVE